MTVFYTLFPCQKEAESAILKTILTHLKRRMKPKGFEEKLKESREYR
jgi:hypothetical protein